MVRQEFFAPRLRVDPKLNFRIGSVLRSALIVLYLSMALLACRSTRADQPSWPSRASLAEFTSLEPIDAHTHISQTGPAFVGMLQRLHMHVLDILYVDDTDPDRRSMEPQRQEALSFVASSMGHAQFCTTFDPFRLNSPDFSKEAIDALNRDFAQGAVAAKVWKNIGMELKNASGQYVLPDDPRFEPVYRNIAAHNKTLVIHAADPDVAWDSRYSTATSARYFAENPQWEMTKKPDAPQKIAILQARDHLLAMNPDLRVVGAHLGSMENQLDDLASRFDLYPNFAVDTAARVGRFARQPRDKVRAFILKYQDRILYGTDLHFSAGATDQAVAHGWENRYAMDWRYFATDDTFEYQGIKVEGLNLPLPVLKKLYHDNAVRWIPGIDANSR